MSHLSEVPRPGPARTSPRRNQRRRTSRIDLAGRSPRSVKDHVHQRIESVDVTQDRCQPLVRSHLSVRPHLAHAAVAGLDGDEVLVPLVQWNGSFRGCVWPATPLCVCCSGSSEYDLPVTMEGDVADRADRGVEPLPGHVVLWSGDSRRVVHTDTPDPIQATRRAGP